MQIAAQSMVVVSAPNGINVVYCSKDKFSS